jgi:hypothetical protein
MSTQEVDLTGSDYSAVRTGYREFWNKLKQVPSINAVGSFDDIFEVEFKEDHIAASTKDSRAFRFRSLPYRFGDRSRVIDVFIQVKQRVRAVQQDNEKRYELKDSNVSLVHLKEEDGTAAIEQGVHFDFSLNTETNHPVFHAQYDPSSVDRNILPDQYDFDFGDRSFPNYPRIPSAPIDLPGAVFLILHDHVPTALSTLVGWPNGPKDAIPNLPQFPKECFEHAPQNGTPMTCDWWYIHGVQNDEDATRRALER